MAGKKGKLSGVKLCKILQKEGFTYSGGKGSHVKLKKIDENGKKLIVIIPLHDEIAPGTLKSILKQAELTYPEFMKLMNSRKRT
ncbi:type II toxin-antitoxin system HicA family toxin [Methanothermobacter sp. CaT2]|uniref:type II toxin-antitoxin system HicA family toxin n=1 Tax=Methanothermobacter sp. TaxID=1884223 RepID=UPI00064E2958